MKNILGAYAPSTSYFSASLPLSSYDQKYNVEIGRKSKAIDIYSKIFEPWLSWKQFLKLYEKAIHEIDTFDKYPRQNVKLRLLLFIGSPEFLSALFYISARGKNVKRFASVQR